MQAQNQLEKFIYGLLEKLRSEGYSIGTDMYIQTIQLFDWFIDKKKNEGLDSFADYLSPVISKSDEEQAKFKVIYREYLARNSNPIIDLFNDRRGHKYLAREYIISRWIVAISLVICVVMAFMTYKPYDPFVEDQQLFRQTWHVARGTEILIPPGNIFKKSGDTIYYDIQTEVHSQKQKRQGISSPLLFERVGRDTFSIFLQSEKYRDTTIIFHDVVVAPFDQIRIEAIPETGIVGEEVRFNAINLDTSGHYPFHWYIEEERVGDQNPLLYTFVTPNSGEGYTVEVGYDEIDTFITSLPGEYKSASLEYTVFDKALHLKSQFYDPEQRFISRPQLGWLGGLLCAIIGLMTLAYAESKKKKLLLGKNSRKEEFKGDQPPYDIQFLSRDHAVLNNHILMRIANELKKRTESPSYFLNIPLTIRKSISNIGFFSPFLSQNQVQREYLFLIDNDYANSQQAKLFTYLTKFFARHSVRINLYYFDQVPEQFYSTSGGPKIPLSTIRDLHHDATLIILSDGSGFVKYTKPHFRDNLAKDFSHWQTRIFITPITVNDWSGHEKLLSTLFQVLPADTIGLRELVGVIESDIRITAHYIHEKLLTYSSKFIDVESAESLRSYLDRDEDLFQWLCAMAIHSKFYWEFFLEMGPAIVKNRSKINYDNLLKLTRISWVHEGNIPPHIRLMLLKELTVDNELLARSTFLHLLDELPDNEREFSYEEKQLSRYTNSFVLAASGRDEYKSDKKILEGEARFLDLYKSGQLSDNPFLIYVEKNQTNTSGWDTPIRTEHGSAGIEEYMESQTGKNNPDLKIKRLSQWRMGGLITAAIILSMLVLTMIFYPTVIANNGINNIVPLVRTEVNIDQVLMMSLLPIECLDSTKTNDSVRVEVIFGNRILDVTGGHSQDTLYGSIPIGRESKEEPGQLSYTVFFQGKQYTEEIEPVAGRYEMKLKGNCLTDGSIIVDYAPGFEEDTSKVLKLSRSFNYNCQVNYPSIPGEYPQSHHFAYTDNIDRDETYRFVSALVNAGLPIDEVRKLIVSSNARENKYFYISGNGNAENKAPISVDSLRCLLLDSCKIIPPIIPDDEVSGPSRIQISYNNEDISGEVRQLRECIDRRTGFIVNPNRFNANFSVNEIVVYNPRVSDSIDLMNQCLRDLFPNKTFTKRTRSGSSNLDAEVFISEKPRKVGLTIQYIRDTDLEIASKFSIAIRQAAYDVISFGSAPTGAKHGITYFDGSQAARAQDVMERFNGLFPDNRLKVKLEPDPERRNDILIVIQGNESLPINPTYQIRNPKIDSQNSVGATGQDHRISGNFDLIISNGPSSATSYASGTVCIDGLPDACTSFNAGNANGTQPFYFLLGAPGQTEGNFKVVVSHKEFGINEGIGTVSLKRITEGPAEDRCDTFHLYVGKAEGAITYQDRDFRNEANATWGLNIRVVKRNEKVATLAFIRPRCEEEVVEVYISERKKFSLCDGTQINFRLTDIGIGKEYVLKGRRGAEQISPLERTKNVEIIFDAIICNRPASGN